jgi:hypothetical protein
MEQNSGGDAQLLLVAKILDRRINIPVETQIADLRVGLGRANSQIHFIAPDREIVFVEPITVGDVDEAAIADVRSSNDI